VILTKALILLGNIQNHPETITARTPSKIKKNLLKKESIKII